MNLDTDSLGSLGSLQRAAPELARPIRISLDGMPVTPFAPRPFRSVLE
jgi:hypothetical protein